MTSQARQLADKSVAPPGRRNLIINGAMQVAQRGTSVTGVGTGYHTADRWYLRRTGSGVTFDSDVTSGVLTCENPSAETGFDLRHGIEWEDRFYGKTMTFTFTATTGSGTIHVDASVVEGGISSTTSEERCHLQGTTTDINTYEGSGLVKSGDNYTITFDVPSDADVSFTPDMLRIQIGNTSAASQSITLTNVQLEVGSTATEFEHRSYGEELLSCYRYLYKWDSGASQDVIATISGYSTTRAFGMYHLPVEMHHDPEIEISGNFRVRMAHDRDVTSGPSVNRATTRDVQMYVDYAASGSAGFSGWLKDKDNTAQIIFEAEL